MLYNKWRPAIFADVLGQPHITKTLLAQLISGRLGHAYLFTGSRGTGKTSCAKILARAVNCLHDTESRRPPLGEAAHPGEPCNKCESCLGIINGSAPDVVEMDAASNTSVEYIRALREELAYSPIMCKKRVYIIDEVHMLSGGAFNAFLKTLEEPPEHALFILATTERHKVPATVASRCQRFAFRRIPGEVIAERLDMVCKGEGISIEPDALELIARIADGALRDALSLLEQCTAAGREFSVTEASVREALGLTGLNDLAAWLMEISDLPKSMARLNELYQGGMDVSAILGQLSALLRDLMMGQMTGDLSLTRLPEKEAEALSGEWPKARILSALEQFAQTRLSRSGDKKLEADLCLIRLANAGGEPPAARASVGADEADSRPQSPVVADDDRPQYKPAGGGRQIASPTGLRSLTDAAADPRWAKLLDSIDNLILKDALKDSGAKVDGDTLIIENSFVWGLVKQSQAEEQIMRFFPGGFWET